MNSSFSLFSTPLFANMRPTIATLIYERRWQELLHHYRNITNTRSGRARIERAVLEHMERCIGGLYDEPIFGNPPGESMRRFQEVSRVWPWLLTFGYAITPAERMFEKNRPALMWCLRERLVLPDYLFKIAYTDDTLELFAYLYRDLRIPFERHQASPYYDYDYRRPRQRQGMFLLDRAAISYRELSHHFADWADPPRPPTLLYQAMRHLRKHRSELPAEITTLPPDLAERLSDVVPVVTTAAHWFSSSP